jgi:flagellar motor switch protein FliN/FliY
MSEAPAPAPIEEPGSYLSVWAESFAEVMGQIAGSPFLFLCLTAAPAEAPAAAEGDLWILATASGSLRGEMSLRLNPKTAVTLAQLFTQEPAAPDSPLTSEQSEAVLELLRQVAGVAANSLRARRGEMQLRLESAPGPPSWSASETIWMQAGGPSYGPVLLECQLSAALVAELRADRATSPSAPSATAPSPAARSTPESKLELLKDVELAMTLRFGARRLLLREVLDLSAGSVIELDRLVRDPADLLLDGRLIARGEVVVVNGNYGLRVSEVVPSTAGQESHGK